MRPQALDLCCKAGGASMGLHRAGFDVVGVDIEPQPRYPFTFVQADVRTLPFDLGRFDFIWASFPCQRWCAGTTAANREGYPDLITPMRPRLEAAGVPFVMENSPLAPIRRDLVLDGTMFPELRVVRKRAFETNFATHQPPSQWRPGLVTRGDYSTVVGGGRCSGVPKSKNVNHTQAAKERAMGIDWMRRDELANAVPPAYSEYIGYWAMLQIDRRLAA